MGAFDFFKKKQKEFFSEAEKSVIVEAVQEAERRTSGEIRVFVESRCRYVDALDRAAEIFFSLQMEKTAQRNAALVYVAVKDRQVAVFGDEGIHQKVTSRFWDSEVRKMLMQFKRDNVAQGITDVVKDIGEALLYHFPFDGETDKNELPDDIMFGH